MARESISPLAIHALTALRDLLTAALEPNHNTTPQFSQDAARRIAEAVAEEREACAAEAEFVANSLGLGAVASVMSDDTESLIRRDAGARVAGRVANVIRARAKNGE